MTYKVVNYVSLLYDTKITKGIFQWVLDDLKRPVLFDVLRLQHEDLIKYDWTPKILDKKEWEN